MLESVYLKLPFTKLDTPWVSNTAQTQGVSWKMRKARWLQPIANMSYVVDAGRL